MKNENIDILIDPLHLEDLCNEGHPSLFDENERYCIFILRLPKIKNDITLSSVGFILTEDKSYLYNSEEQTFQPLENLFLSPHKILNKMVDHLLKSFLVYQNLTVEMEESLYNNSTSNEFMPNWLELKRDILRIEHLLIRASESTNEMLDAYKEVEDFPITSYTDLHEHIERLHRSATLQLSKLDYIYSFYNTRTNEKMNKLIYILTIISSVFLPLNLIVGFFGMNTSGLPLSTGESGTLFAVALMLILLAIAIASFFRWRSNVE